MTDERERNNIDSNVDREDFGYRPPPPPPDDEGSYRGYRVPPPPAESGDVDPPAESENTE